MQTPAPVLRRLAWTPEVAAWPPRLPAWTLPAFAAWVPAALVALPPSLVEQLAAGLPQRLVDGGGQGSAAQLGMACWRWSSQGLDPLAGDVGATLAAGLPPELAASERAATLRHLARALHRLLARRLLALLVALAQRPAWWARGADPAWRTACLTELLRLHPVQGSVLREVGVTLWHAGYQVPAGWRVAALPAHTHTDAAAFPQPACFAPERFLGRAPGDAWMGWDDDWRGHLFVQLVLPALHATLAWLATDAGASRLRQWVPGLTREGR